MAATAMQIAQLRGLTAESTSDTYVDSELAAILEEYPLLDELGIEPFVWDYSTTPPSKHYQDTWIPTYDLHAAAAQVWQEKASRLAANYDFSADGASYSRSQAYEMAMKQSRYHAARRHATTIKQIMEPRRTGQDGFPANARESED